MYRYLVLIWNASDQRKSAAARLLSNRLHSASPDWTCALDRRGLIIFHAGDRVGSSETCVLDPIGGAVFGKLFEKGDSTHFFGTPAVSATENVPLSASSLLEHCCGRYVAVAENAAADTVWVLRDPTGALPCFLTTFRGVNVFFSDLEDCLGLGLLRFSINWSYISAAVANSALQVRETGLTEVTEVLPGECVELRGDTLQRSLLWNPIDIALREPIANAEEAVSELRDTTRACVRIWSNCYDGILHSLSGGLDSSIVLSCIAHAPHAAKITCLNYFASGPDEDERRYARLAAQRAGVALIERELDVAAVNLGALANIRRSAKPGYYMAALQLQRLEADLALDVGASAIFSGGGGDAIFYQARADLAVADFVHQHGLHPELWRTTLAAAHITGLSVWSLLRRGLRTSLLRPAWQPPLHAIADRSIVNPEAIQASRTDPRWRHPWLANTHGVPHGKLWHVLSLSVPTNFYESFGGENDPERTYPLVSQPLIELCLRIPTYVLIDGGWDRAIARRAFADDLPREIIERRAKGAINQLSTRILDANVAFVREMLLDGLLVREGILDRSRLEACLSGRRSPTDTEHNEILHEHLSIEAWLQRWHGLEHRAVA